MVRKISMHSEARIEFGREVRRHPELWEKICENDTVGVGFTDVLALACAYVGMGVDGTFTPRQLDSLTHDCVLELRRKREIIVNTIDMTTEGVIH